MARLRQCLQLPLNVGNSHILPLQDDTRIRNIKSEQAEVYKEIGNCPDGGGYSVIGSAQGKGIAFGHGSSLSGKRCRIGSRGHVVKPDTLAARRDGG
jgi:hypothetical protein